MLVHFLAHSGFYVELEHHALLFDWWTGDLPPLTDKPLLVFASHHHEDHFDPKIFELAQQVPEVHFLLGKDIRFAPSNRKRWGLTPQIEEKCLRLGGYRKEEPMEGVLVETLPSTDEGVAFVVTIEGRTLYHAGDLNWWYWAEEPDPWNPDMERNFKQYIEPLRGRHIDLAMVPLDPRLQQGQNKGLAYLLELAQVDHVLPMHQWEDYSATDRFLQDFPQWRSQILPIHEAGQQFTLP